MTELKIYIRNKLKEFQYYDEKNDRFTYYSKKSGLITFDKALRIILESYYPNASNLIYDIEVTDICINLETYVKNCALAVATIEKDEFVVKSIVFDAYIK